MIYLHTRPIRRQTKSRAPTLYRKYEVGLVSNIMGLYMDILNFAVVLC